MTQVKGKKDAVGQLSDEEIDLQKYGVKLKNLQLAGKEVPDTMKVELILWDLKIIIKEKKFNDVKIAYLEAKEAHKHKKANPRDDKKVDKIKSNPKFQAKDQKITPTEDEDSEPSFQEQFPYHNGFILVGFPETEAQAQ